jgi:hypothetical protein
MFADKVETFVNYDRKKLYNTGHSVKFDKTFYSHNLQMFQTSTVCVLGRLFQASLKSVGNVGTFVNYSQKTFKTWINEPSVIKLLTVIIY